MKLPLIRRSVEALVLGLGLVSSVTAAPTVGVLLKGRSAFWSAVEKGATDSAQRHGLEVVVKMPMTEADIAVQVQLLNAMVAQGIQAIVVAPDSKDALAAPVAAAIAKGIKVVVLDSPISGPMPVFVSTNHEDAGTAAGKLLASLVADTDEVCILKHSQAGVATGLRENSGYTALREAHPNLVVHRDIFSGSEAGLEEQKAKLVFTQHPNTKAVLASSTPATMAMLKILEEKKLAGSVKLVGFGFNLNSTVATALQNGALHGWIAQIPSELGAKAVDTAAALLKGETLPEKIYCDFVVITKANLNDAKVQALLQ